ncbi:pilus assembly protein N-terminal domain-containing protein [Achromobacter sp. GG226]|uniref:type II and III secretion system protein family protein n=1 Tax=Verticiella alkaliphila TaxID=2779529 RepID=UPI001C0CEB8A|nr:pilus assembly protein N-terminal domain-containing protein [Verticiella sp. GG226]MBU4610123.1 pilus assembly protein N-terminal domain-containing protein [Verticiella sp. GG226]
MNVGRARTQGCGGRRRRRARYGAALALLLASLPAGRGQAQTDVRWAQWAEPPRDATAPGAAAPLSEPTPAWALPPTAFAPTPTRSLRPALPASPTTGPGVSATAAASPARDPLAAPLPGATASAHAEALELFAGETRVIAAPAVARIAVGDGNVLHAAAADGREVVVFARGVGATSLVLWSRDGSSRVLRVDVVPGEARRIQAELAAVLDRIPGVRSTVVGDKLIVEGDGLSDADQVRLSDLVARYPQVIDLTGPIGWDRMVLFDVQVVELPRSQMQDLGVRWDTTSSGGINAAGVWDAGSKGAFLERPGAAGAQAAFPAAGPAGYLGLNAVLSARLHALSQRGDAVLLAQPQLLARSGATASFLAGGELPYTTVDANGNSSTVFKPYGVGLDVTPRIDRSGTVRARIEVEVSAVDPVVTTTSGPALRTRRTATEFNVRSGQTLVLSGFLSREQVTDEDAVPGLSRIPLLGALFRAQRVQQRDTELAIFVTPVLVGADDPGLAQRVREGRAVLDATFSEPTRLFGPPGGSLAPAVPIDPFRLESP